MMWLLFLCAAVVCGQIPPPPPHVPWPQCKVSVSYGLEEGAACGYTGVSCGNTTDCCKYFLECKDGACNGDYARTMGDGDSCSRLLSVGLTCGAGAPLWQCLGDDGDRCTYLRPTGDKCKDDGDCLSGQCQGGVCGAPASCTYDEECAFTDYCQGGACAPRAGDGESCAADPCLYGSTCNPSDATCKGPGSVAFLDPCTSFNECTEDFYCSGECDISFSTFLYDTYEHECAYDAAKDWNGCARPTPECACNPFSGRRACQIDGAEEYGPGSVVAVIYTILATYQSGYICPEEQRKLMQCMVENECASFVVPQSVSDSCPYADCKYEVEAAQSCLCKAYTDYLGDNVFTGHLHCGRVWKWWYTLLIVVTGLCCCGGAVFTVIVVRRSRVRPYNPTAQRPLINPAA